MPARGPCTGTCVPFRGSEPEQYFRDSPITISYITPTNYIINYNTNSYVHTTVSVKGWRLHRDNILLARGPKVHSLYLLYFTLKENGLFLVDLLVSSL
mgnify:CR=1 FL=1